MLDIVIANTNQTVHVPEGTSIRQLLEASGIPNSESIVAATMNNLPVGLNTCLFMNKTIRFIDRNCTDGKMIYMNSLVLVLNKAVNDTIPGATLRVEHSISDGFFCIVSKNGEHINEAVIASLRQRMAEIIEADKPILHISTPTKDAIKLFSDKGLNSVSDILKYRKNFYTTYYAIDSVLDYFPGTLVISTGYLKKFDLQPYYDGMLLQDSAQITPMPKLYQTYKNNWSLEQKARLTNIADINAISTDQLQILIKISEALHEKNIVRIADKVTNNPKIRVVLVAGPSSSGKTTFSKRLSVQIAASGVRPIPLSLDNYFVNRADTPIDENGEHDFESLYSLDLERFYTDIQALIKGEEVETPVYNFETGKRNEKGIQMKLNSNEVLIIEGLHAINPELTKSLPQEALIKVFVSALNTLSLNNHNCIPADDTRLLRRIIRDYKYRCYSAEDTILRWPSVRRGEKKWIEPFQESVDEIFNSSLLFELAAIRRQAEPILLEVPHYSDAYPVAHRLLRLLNFIKPIPFSSIPATSLLREFLGGSGFKY
ncbi:MAG: nucleoside kinase [Paludibacteraceae bacterium]|nr:nucleoside kinase [Paludibacteraceae bacterium]